MNETEDEEHSVIDNSVLNVPSYFKLFESGKNVLNNIYAMYKRACMATSQEKWNTEKLRYGRA